MNTMFKKFLPVIMLFSIVAIQAGTQPTTPTFVMRSQSFNGARKNAGLMYHTNMYDMDKFYGTFSVTSFYQRSDRPDDIAECLFGNDLIKANDCDGRSIRIQGSNVANRNNNTSWLADYFYLPDDFQSTISFDPRIQNAGADFHFWVGLDEWVNGLYFRIYAPVNWTKWDLDFKESSVTAGTANHPEGRFSPQALPRTSLLDNFAAYASGGQVENLTQNRDNAGNDTTKAVTITFQPLRFAKLRSGNKSDDTETQLADLRAELGWNFFNEEDYHFGLNIQAAAPTGNKRKAEFAFHPVVGNSNKWELGGGLNAHYTFWRSEDEEKAFGFYVDASILHLFKSEEERTFDLNNKPVSRYMLAERLGTPNTFSVGNQAGTTLATAVFQNEYAPVANLTTATVDVSVPVQGYVTAWFNYMSGGICWDFGYEYWGRSCEKIDRKDGCPNPLADGKTWALKGDAHVFGFASNMNNNPPIAANDAIALSATQSGATINAGLVRSRANDQINRVNTIDARQDAFAISDGAAAPATRAVLSTNRMATNNIGTSLPPKFLGTSDVDLRETRGMSHKVFSHFSYTWDREGWIPYLGIGASAEFGKTEDTKSTSCPTTTTTSSTTCPSDCIDCAVSQWEIWLKAGISFD